MEVFFMSKFLPKLGQSTLEVDNGGFPTMEVFL